MLGQVFYSFSPENEVVETFLRGEVEDIDDSDDIFEVGGSEFFVMEFSDDVPEASVELLLSFFKRRDELSGRNLHSYSWD